MIDGILRTSAARHGDRRALVAGGRTLSYRQLHDAFGGRNQSADLGPIMKRLLEIKESN